MDSKTIVSAVQRRKRRLLKDLSSEDYLILICGHNWAIVESLKSMTANAHKGASLQPTFPLTPIIPKMVSLVAVGVQT